MRSAIAIALLSLVMMSAAASAQDAETVDSTTLGEIRAMTTSYGAEVRLLQLEKSIERNILFGQDVIERAKEANESYDTSGLEALVEELGIIKDEIAAIDPEGNLTDVVTAFIDLKNDARDITAQFRDEARALFEPGEIDGMRAQIGRAVEGNLTALSNRIRNAVRVHNAEMVTERLHEMGLNGTQLAQRLMNGTAGRSEVASQIRAMLQGVDAQKRQAAVQAVQMRMASNAVRAESAVQSALQGYGDRMQQRLSERIHQVESSAEMIQQRLDMAETSPQAAPASGPMTGNAVGYMGGRGR